MSTYDELKARCARRLGRKKMSFDADFLDEMKAAQERLEREPFLPEWMNQQTFFTLNAGEYSIELGGERPIRFAKELAVRRSDVINDPGDLRGVRYTRTYLFEDMQKIWEGELDTNSGIWFYDRGLNKIWVAPKETETRAYYYSRYVSQVVLNGANTNDWIENEPELILGEAGIQLAIWLRDERALSYFVEMRNEAKKQMQDRDEAEQQSDVELVMGGAD